MQNNNIQSFRARLRFLGYKDISIKRAKQFRDQEIYRVTCRDPFCALLCERYMTILDMFYWR